MLRRVYASLPLVMGDELRIRQILLNLVSNAAKFTEQGFITLNAKVQDDKLLFSVEDTGIGIPIDVQSALFNRFKQGSSDTARKYGGTGLGLSISRELALMHGGEIWFRSEPGEGTTFYFTIPLAKPEAGAPRRTEPRPIWKAESAPGLSSRVSVFSEEEIDAQTLIQQILLVDARAETRNALQATFTDGGYDVFPADQSEAIQTLASALMPDVIVVHLHSDDKPQLTALPDALRQDQDLADTPVVALKELKADKQAEWSGLVLAQVHNALHGAQVSSSAA